MGKVKFLICLLLVLTSIFLCSKKAYAAEKKVVITEVMYDLSGSDAKREWMEILNLSDQSLKLSAWKFNDGSNHNLNVPEGEQDIWITPGEYMILADDRDTFLAEHPTYQGEAIDTVMALNNSADTVSLIDDTANIIDTVTYDKSWGAGGNGRTLEKIDPLAENTISNWQESFVLGGTPGETSSTYSPPNYPDEVFGLVNFEHAIIKTVQVSSIVDGDTIKVSGLTGFPSDIRLLGIDCPETGQVLAGPATAWTKQLSGKTIDLVISQNPSEQLDLYNRTLAVIIFEDQVFNAELLDHGLATYYQSSNTLIKEDVWKDLAENARAENLGIWASSGGRSAILSELLPNPIGDDTQGEWLEIYNPLDREVNLSYFLIDQYLIPYGVVIGPKSWLVFPRSQTGIILNNSGGELKLFFPDGILIDQTSFGEANEGETWALINDSWAWTNQPSPGQLNIASVNAGNSDTDNSEKEGNIPVNSIPIEIDTGEFSNYQNYIVEVTGVVIETSGNTFYLDDGSGQVKIYIQEAAGIDKPPMHKNDIFKITGIVNLYRSTWRILPRTVSDIVLIKSAKQVTAKASTKKSSTKSSGIDASALSLGSTIKKVAAAEDSSGNSAKKSAPKTPYWIQVIEALVGMAVIVFVVFLFKIFSVKRERPIGYDFGNDET